jgi:hypothetical protein
MIAHMIHTVAKPHTSPRLLTQMDLLQTDVHHCGVSSPIKPARLRNCQFSPFGSLHPSFLQMNACISFTNNSSDGATRVDPVGFFDRQPITICTLFTSPGEDSLHDVNGLVPSSPKY